MKGSENQLLTFLEGANNQYIIPVYQRKYDWKKKHCQQLYEDLKKTIQENKESHFFGSIVSQLVPEGRVNFHSKCKMLGGVAEFFSEAFLCRFPPEALPRPVVYPVHSLPV